MKAPGPLISFQARIVLLALAGLLALGLVFRDSRSRPAPLRQSSIDLRYHELSHLGDRPPPSVVLLGGSEILGVTPALQALLSPHAVVEVFQPDTNLVNILALAEPALRSHPKFVVVSVQPSSNRFTPLGSAVSFLNADRLKSFLSEDLWRFLDAQSSPRLRLFFRALAGFEWLDNSLIPAQRTLRSARDSWLGNAPPPIVESTPDPYLHRLLHGPQLSLTPELPGLLHGLNELAKRQGTRLVIYQSPFSTEAYLAEKTEPSPWRDETTRAALAAEKISFFDYRDLFSNTADFFLDAVHLTPAGANLIAASLLEDLAGADLPGNPCEKGMPASPCGKIKAASRSDGPCTQDETRFCPRSDQRGQENCLWQHFDQLSPACKVIRQRLLSYDPCLKSFAEYCDHSPRRDGKGCLWRQFAQLPPACQGVLKFSLDKHPCVEDRSLYCTSLSRTEDLRACLLRNRPRLSASCLATLPRLAGNEPAGPGPCELDHRLRCPDVAENKKWICLGQHFAELAPQCQQLEAAREKAYPCERELALHCGTVPKGERSACLIEHFQDLNRDCAHRVNLGAAGEMFDLL